MKFRLYFLALCCGSLLIVIVLSCTSRVYSVFYEKVRYPPQHGRTKQLTASDFQERTLSQNRRCYHTLSDWTQRPKSREELAELQCEQRLPKVLIIGARTSGSQTLSRVLGFHPQVATPPDQVQFFDRYYRRGSSWYLSQMPYTTPDQVTVEATENYLYHKNASVRAVKVLGGETKIIVLFRDPVARSISDYLVTQSRLQESKIASAHYKGDFKESRSRDRFPISGKGKHGRRGSTKMSFTIQDTLEKTVFRAPDDVNNKNVFITDSLYVYYLRVWFKKFATTQVLPVNAEIFARTPAETLSQVENFLGLRSYFRPEHFNFDLNNSHFCLREPQSICMPQPKVQYPVINEITIRKLREHFEDSCRYLFLLLKRYLQLIGDVPLNYAPIE